MFCNCHYKPEGKVEGRHCKLYLGYAIMNADMSLPLYGYATMEIWVQIHSTSGLVCPPTTPEEALNGTQRWAAEESVANFTPNVVCAAHITSSAYARITVGTRIATPAAWGEIATITDIIQQEWNDTVTLEAWLYAARQTIYLTLDQHCEGVFTDAVGYRRWKKVGSYGSPARPKATWATLVAYLISRSDSKTMSTDQLHDAIVAEFPWFAMNGTKDKWKGCIQYTLCSRKEFVPYIGIRASAGQRKRSVMWRVDNSRG
ncbi:hypothetical protein B0H16DRAFT_1447291 [Mycena metata]|uniref:Fork-head domain-containing protein n=1 Tax=Mycena metata TaxID=1033252 RepID=A0AAD7P0W3_9AGAR|nr:hypothetical protein B0H16DRAFT_1447291 [Mycena metata]